MNKALFRAKDFSSLLMGVATFKYFSLTGYKSVSTDSSVIHKIDRHLLLIALNELVLDQLSLQPKNDYIGTLLPS